MKMESKGCRPDISLAFPNHRMMPGLQPLDRFNARFPGAVPQAGMVRTFGAGEGPTARFVQGPTTRFVRGPTARPHPSLWHRHSNWASEWMEGCKPGFMSGIRCGNGWVGPTALGSFQCPISWGCTPGWDGSHLWCSGRKGPTTWFVRGPTARPHPSLWHRHRNWASEWMEG